MKNLLLSSVLVLGLAGALSFAFLHGSFCGKCDSRAGVACSSKATKASLAAVNYHPQVKSDKVCPDRPGCICSK